ncbi:hypothetical protein J4475_01560, partial [Candidatus Woesearchaeota archaeon]|nr:hypothetical protein [Candidatus Woesearchaeota archaeon]
MTTVSYGKRGELIKELDSPRFLLADQGNYFSLPTLKRSRYDGFFVFNETMYRVIDSIGTGESPERVEVHPNLINAISRSNAITYHLSESSLILQAKNKESFTISLDCRQSYDTRKFGKNYKILFYHGLVLVTFEKQSDEREDTSGGEKEFTLFIAIKHDGSFIKTDKWREVAYQTDVERNSPPADWWVYDAVRINAKKIVVTAGFHRDLVVKEAEEKFSKPVNEADVTDEAALTFARGNLHALIANNSLLAGLPWFFQNWSRDTMISLKGLAMMGETGMVKNILEKSVMQLTEEGRLKNINNKGYETAEASADGVLWFTLRMDECLKLFTRKEKLIISKILEHNFARLWKAHSKDELMTNGHKQTWMDTDWEDEGRAGARIEIQALTLRYLALLCRLTKKTVYADEEKLMRKRVKDVFFREGKLWDGPSDPTQRPNIFLAYYAYPKLLAKKEWEIVFDAALGELWLDWGGLATISRHHPHYSSMHTGENNQSYHRGDSWYFVNNIAAMAMNSVNPRKYREKIRKIMEASTKDILWLGVCGTASELSSASQQTG